MTVRWVVQPKVSEQWCLLSLDNINCNVPIFWTSDLISFMFFFNINICFLDDEGTPQAYISHHVEATGCVGIGIGCTCFCLHDTVCLGAPFYDQYLFTLHQQRKMDSFLPRSMNMFHNVSLCVRA